MVTVSARRAALCAFFLVALVFFFASVAAVEYYLEITHSVQSVQAHCSSFKALILDDPNGTFAFHMTLVNPSGAPLKVQLLSYAIYLNGRLVAARAFDYSVQGLRIAPRSNTTLVVSTQLMPSEVNAILQGPGNVVWNWELRGTLRLRTAIESDFQISFRQLFNA